MNVRPLHDWAVIRPYGAEEMTAGGIIIPDTAKEKPQGGVVEAIGPGAYEEEKRGKKKDEKKERKFIPTTVKPGDYVLFEKYAGQTYTFDREDFILVRERDILGILPDGPPRPRPLQLPSKTTSSGSTALMKSPAAASKNNGAGGERKPAKKAAAQPKKKAAGKTAKKGAKPAAKKSGGKKAGKKK